MIFVVALLILSLLAWTAWKLDGSLSADFAAARRGDKPQEDPDPWETELSKEELAEIFSDPYPICVNCARPDSAPVWICEHCGCPTGPYSAFMPYIHVFWLGWLFRSGVDGSIKMTPFRALGLIISAALNYGIFAPLYLYRLLRSARGKPIAEKPAPPPPPAHET